jgi:hypothetical protein
MIFDEVEHRLGLINLKSFHHKFIYGHLRDNISVSNKVVVSVLENLTIFFRFDLLNHGSEVILWQIYVAHVILRFGDSPSEVFDASSSGTCCDSLSSAH